MNGSPVLVAIREGVCGATASVSSQGVLLAVSAADDSHSLEAEASTHLYLTLAKYLPMPPTDLVIAGELRYRASQEILRQILSEQAPGVRVHDAKSFLSRDVASHSYGPLYPKGLEETVVLAQCAYTKLYGAVERRQDWKGGVPFQVDEQTLAASSTIPEWQQLIDSFQSGVILPIVVGPLGWPRSSIQRACISFMHEGERLSDLLPQEWLAALPSQLTSLRGKVTQLAFPGAGLINSSSDLLQYMQSTRAPYALVEGQLWKASQ